MTTHIHNTSVFPWADKDAIALGGKTAIVGGESFCNSNAQTTSRRTYLALLGWDDAPIAGQSLHTLQA